MPKFSIVIVVYNSQDWIFKCLSALQIQTFTDFEVIIVDNASSDSSMEIVDNIQFPQIKTIRNDQNYGFSGGCNIGARAATAEWLIFLNPDTMARPDWLERIVDGQGRYADTRVFACAQYNLGDTGRLDGTGDAYSGFGIPWRGGFGYPVAALPEEGDCFSPCGASAVIQKDVFERAGGFDERFFCYCEDVDLGFRLRLMGERCVFLNKAAIDHQGSAISGRYSDFTVYHGTRNRMWTYFKNMPLGLLLLTLPVHVSISIYLLLKSIFVGRFKSTFRGMKDGLLGLPKIWASRHNYQKPSEPVMISKAMSWSLFALHQRRPCVKEF